MNMSKSELNEKHQIDILVSQEATSGYLRARSAGIEVTVLEGNDIVRLQGDQRVVIGTIPECQQVVNQHYTLSND